MNLDNLATPCLLYCGSCAYYLTEECKGCGSESRYGCDIYNCCRLERKLNYCTECNDFPCEALSKSVGIHPKWLESQKKILQKQFSEIKTLGKTANPKKDTILS